MRAYLVCFFCITMLITATAVADIKSLAAVYFEQKGSMSTPMQLNCNWDKNLSSVTIYGYYGVNGAFQDVITPEALRHDDPASTDIWFKLPAISMTHANGMPLHHIDIDYQVTRRRCKNGFDFSGGLVR